MHRDQSALQTSLVPYRWQCQDARLGPTRPQMNQPGPNGFESGNGADALIYVVDDEPMLLELAAVVLEPHGFKIKTFRDPQSALQAFASAQPPPVLVITDYAMHSMT